MFVDCWRSSWVDIFLTPVITCPLRATIIYKWLTSKYYESHTLTQDIYANLNGPFFVLIIGKSIVNVSLLTLAAFSIISFLFDWNSATTIGSTNIIDFYYFVQQYSTVPPASVLSVTVLSIPTSGSPFGGTNLTAVTCMLYSVYGLRLSSIKSVTLITCSDWL